MARFHLTNKAVEDLDSIWFYTIEKWSENQADKYYRTLSNEFQEIADTKRIIDREYIEIHPGLYGRHCQKHVIFYRLIDKEVEIVRILHEKMDYASKFANEDEN